MRNSSISHAISFQCTSKQLFCFNLNWRFQSRLGRLFLPHAHSPWKQVYLQDSLRHLNTRTYRVGQCGCYTLGLAIETFGRDPGFFEWGSLIIYTSPSGLMPIQQFDYARAASLHIADITPCSSLKVKRWFGGTYRLHLQGRIIRAR
jgi:hypothetical protein